MPILRMPKAQPTGRERVPGLVITFAEEVPEFPEVYNRLGLAVARNWYLMRAERFVDALQRAAPGGFVDALLGVLHARAASVFVVPDVVEPERWGQSPIASIAQALGEDAGCWTDLGPHPYAHAGDPHSCVYCDLPADLFTEYRCEPSIDFLLERSERMSRDARSWQDHNPKVARLKAADAALVAARAAARMEAEG